MSERDQSPPATADLPTADHDAASPPGATAPEYSSAPVAARHPDPVAALLLLLAGVAAGISLLLPWLADDGITGLTLVRDGFGVLGDGVGEVLGTGYIQPLTIVLGGGVLFVVGLLLLLPARRHRAVGLLALVISVLVVLAVLVPLVIAGWDLGFFAIGFWFAMAVAVLGLLGAFKAVLTGPKES